MPIYFDTHEVFTEFGKPVSIYAAAPSKESSSIRSIQTVIPLAAHLNLEINQNFSKKNIDDLVENVMSNPYYFGRTVVICWDHLGIPKMARLFGANESPPIFGKNLYDRTWVIRFTGDKATRFKNLAQKLLPGDSPE